MAVRNFLKYEVTCKGDNIELLPREISFCAIPIMIYVNENLKMVSNKYFEGVRYSSIEFVL